MRSALSAFDAIVEGAASLNGADPSLVLVLEAVDERGDLGPALQRLDLEMLFQAEGLTFPDADFQRQTGADDEPVGLYFHAVCVSKSSMESLIVCWKKWKRTQRLPRGYKSLEKLFAHLKDLRPWSSQDRLRNIDWDAYFAGLEPERDQEVEIELWFRGSPQLRDLSEQSVRALVIEALGQVQTSSTIESIGYHALKCLLPPAALQRLAAGDFDAVRLVKSANVMYLRPLAQTSVAPGEDVPVSAVAGDPPTARALLCLLDGVPVQNHPLLRGRIELFDPDDYGANAPVAERRHGTSMASIAVWGDRSANNPPADRLVLVRPILTPNDATLNHVEEIGSRELAPDLMMRAFRELFESPSNPSLAELLIVNLSVGDPGSPFETVSSAWARAIDWLSYTYGVLVIVSAGNHYTLASPPTSPGLDSLAGSTRRDLAAALMTTSADRRRILSPGESMNALTVGALHSDGLTENINVGYRIDPADGLAMSSPVSAIGHGIRASIKPDLTAPGGRVLFEAPLPGVPLTEYKTSRPGSLGPGVRVAAPDVSAETFDAGTSAAAAEVSRRATQLAEVVLSTAPVGLSRRQYAVATKALLAHSARIPGDLPTGGLSATRLFGFGQVERDISLGCEPNEATVYFTGSLGGSQEQSFEIPLPDGLQARGPKRLVTTLAWLTPINWRHREYRRAALRFAKPTGFVALDSPSDANIDPAKRGTVQHLVWESEKTTARGFGQSIALTVQCWEQAGGLNGAIVDFALAVTIWTAPELQVNVYEAVRTQLRTRIRPSVAPS